jgi:two-component system, LytTR family, response regulator
MRVIIVDDEAAARQRLVRILAALDVTVAGVADNGLDALELAARERPDVILLDIEMPEVSGLDVARRLSHPRPLVIFQTAHDRYALEAFEREAIDYVLKPVTHERLADALARAARRLAERRPSPVVTARLAERLAAAVPHAGTRPPRRLLVRYRAGHRLLPVAEIERFHAEDGLVYAVTAAASFAADDSLRLLERRLAGLYVRIGRADLVSIAHVDRLASNGDGSATITMKDGTTVRVSRRRAAGVKRALEA